MSIYSVLPFDDPADLALVEDEDSLSESELKRLQTWLESSVTSPIPPARMFRSPIVDSLAFFEKPKDPYELGHVFTKERGMDWCYVRGTGEWMRWDNGWSKTDREQEIIYAVREFARGHYYNFVRKEGSAEPKPKLDPQKGSTVAVAKSAMNVVANLPPVVTEERVWDSDNYILGLGRFVEEGKERGWLLDTRERVFREQTRRDYFSKHTAGVPTDYRKSRWWKLICRALPNELERRWFGCFIARALLGRGAKEGLFVPGCTDTAKSTILEALVFAMNDYARMMPAELFIGKKGDSFTKVDLKAKMKGMRLICISETEDGKLDQYLLKSLMSTDRQVGRTIGKGSIEYVPFHAIIFAFNDTPDLSEADEATWNRLTFLPFLNRIPKAEQIDNFATFLQSEEEVGAILGWIVEHVILWLDKGMPPKSEGMEEYKKDCREANALENNFADYLGMWYQESNENTGAILRNIHEGYTEHCNACKIVPIWGRITEERMQKRVLAKYLRAMGLEIERHRVGAGEKERIVYGIEPFSEKEFYVRDE